MNDRNDIDIDMILKNRRVPHSPEGLSERIIAASYRADEVQAVPSRAGSVGFFAEISRLFIIPKPAYAFAVLFVIGVISGAQIDLSITSDSHLSDDFSGLIQMDSVWSDDFSVSEDEV